MSDLFFFRLDTITINIINHRIYALHALLTSLSPLIGAELELGHAVPAGWTAEVSKDRLDDWREDGMELKEEVEETLMDTFNAVYWPLMRKVSVGQVILISLPLTKHDSAFSIEKRSRLGSRPVDPPIAKASRDSST